MPHRSPLTLPLDGPLASRRERHGQGLLIAGGVLLGTIGVFVEEAGQHPLLTVWFRCAFGALALCLWGLASGRLGELRLGWRHGWVIGLSGALMILNWVLFFAAIPRTSIGVATVVFHIQPIWVMLFGAWALRESVSPGQWAAVLLALTGLTLTSGLLNDASTRATLSPDYVLGLLMCLGGSLSYAAVTLIAKTQRQVSSFALAWWQCAVGLLLLFWVPWVHGWPTHAAAWPWLVGLGVFHTGLAYVILFTGMARLGTGKIAVLQFVYPLTAVLLDWLVYGRTLQPAQILGVLLMALALWGINRPRTPLHSGRVSAQRSGTG